VLMEVPKTFFVTGATGNVGGAATRHLLSNGYKVTALVRNPASAKAKKLQERGAILIKGDLNEPTSYKPHLKNTAGVFAVFTFTNGTVKEIKQGIALADAAKEYRVPHFVYSSVIGSDVHTGIPHWESKFVIEQHIKSIGLTHTILRPSSFYENFLLPQVKSRLLKGKLITPANENKVQQFISTEDVGKIAAIIFENEEQYKNKTLILAAEEMNMQQVAATFSEVMGIKMSYGRLPPILTRLFMGKDLYKMFTWINNNDVRFLKDLDGFKKEFPGLLDLKTWIHQKFQLLPNARSV
jgi:uncharacterized protein YbjT (DUF2867 family)